MPVLLPYYGALALGIALGVVGQVLLKSGSERSVDLVTQFLNPFTIIGLGFYAVGAICYILAIKKIPVSIAFPMVSVSYVAVALIAHYAWGETFGAPQMAGIALIAGGIFMLFQ
jgi:small multidrug resistance pump